MLGPLRSVDAKSLGYSLIIQKAAAKRAENSCCTNVDVDTKTSHAAPSEKKGTHTLRG